MGIPTHFIYCNLFHKSNTIINPNVVIRYTNIATQFREYFYKISDYLKFNESINFKIDY